MTANRSHPQEKWPSATPASGEKQAGREEDIDFAHTVARTLNRLIDEGVLKTESINDASREAMEEFIVRFRRLLSPKTAEGEDFTPAQHALLKTMFGEAQPEEKPGKNPERQETIEIMKSFWQEVKRHGIQVQGFLLYGSRMDPEKAPRSVAYAEHTFFTGHERPYMSDIDAVAVIERGFEEDWQDLRVRLNEIAEKWRGENPDIPQINVELITPSGFFEILQGRGGLEVADIPGWAWKPEAPLYIGWPLQHWPEAGGPDLVNYPPEEVNKQLRVFLNSKRLRDAKDQIIAAIKENVKAAERAG